LIWHSAYEKQAALATGEDFENPGSAAIRAPRPRIGIELSHRSGSIGQVDLGAIRIDTRPQAADAAEEAM
jgi:hypothetical protein